MIDAAFTLFVFALSHERDALIREVNSAPGVLWTAGVNPRFAGRPVGAARSLCGVHEHSKAELKAKG